MSDELLLTLLGKVEISRQDTPVAGPTRKKSLALLAYLACTARPHSREALAGLLWGQATEANARAGLRKALADLRDVLAPHLVISRSQVCFDRTRPYWLDVEVFERQVGQGLQALERDGALTDEGASALAAAIELYQGDFLEGFYVRRAPAFEEWVLLERERLRLSALQALHALAAHCCARGAHAEGIAYTARLLAMAPGQEEAHRQMMSLLALSGQKGAALVQYETCCRVLSEQLGVEPEAETTALYERVRDGARPKVHRETARHNLPVPPTPTLGRKRELDAIAARLRDPACRLLTLVGPGGSGKTRLAVEAGTRLASREPEKFADGVFLCPLAPLRSAEALVPAIAHSLGFRFHQEGEPRQQLLDCVRYRNLLLVLDNFEHLLVPPSVSLTVGGTRRVELVSQLLRTAPGLKVLVTSRARLSLQAEHIYPVAGLSCPESESAPCFAAGGLARDGDEGSYPAIQLFLQTARRAQPDLDLTHDTADVARICRLVEGMPLAILLAASWTRALRPGQIAALLARELDGDAYGAGQGLDLLETDWRDVPARQRSMRAVFDHSWRLLTEREQAVLAALSVFRGGFTPQVAHEVTGASLHELLSLADRSLLQRTAPGRYDLHELLRQYAEGKLEERPAAAQRARDRHSRTFCAALEGWAADLKCTRQQQALAEMDAEIANARAAWDWAAARGPTKYVGQAMEGLRLYYSWRLIGEGTRSPYVAIVERFRHALPPPDQEDHALAKRVLALSLVWHAPPLDAERTEQLFQESMALLDDLSRAGHDTRAERALVLLDMGDRMCLVDLEQAQSLHEHSIDLCRSLGNTWELAETQARLAACLINQGRYGQAERLYQEALTAYRTLGDQRGVAHALQGGGLCALLQGHPEGEHRVREAMAVYQEMDDRNCDRYMDVLWALSQTLLLFGRYTEAHALLEKRVTEPNSAKDRWVSNILLSIAKNNLGQYTGARACGQMGLDLARGAGNRGDAGVALYVIGSVALAEGAYAEAARLLQESVAAHRQVGESDRLSWALACLACATWRQGDLKGALQHAREALWVATQVESFLSATYAVSGMSLLSLGENDTERAIELEALASSQPVMSNSRWFEDVIGRPIAAAAAALPPEVVAAAQERGRTRDLETAVRELLTELDER